jgi:hypothetical protein
MNSTCSNCAFWEAPQSEPKQVGECRRYAPRPSVDEGHAERATVFTTWPNTYESDWCGEFDLRTMT